MQADILRPQTKNVVATPSIALPSGLAGIADAVESSSRPLDPTGTHAQRKHLKMSNSHSRFQLLLLLMGSFLLTGCGRKNPVQEITVNQSGVEIADEPISTEGEWNAWRGPANDGIAAPQSLATNWDERTNVLWRSNIEGRGHGSPIVVGSSVYLAVCYRHLHIT